MYCEDVDICWRCWQAGREVWYAPDAVVTHAIGRSSDKNADKMIVEFHRSWYEFDRKRNPGLRPLRRAAVAAGLWLRAAVRILKRRARRATVQKPSCRRWPRRRGRARDPGFGLLLRVGPAACPRLSGVPDEPLYSSWLCAARHAGRPARRESAGRICPRDRSGTVPARRAEKAFAALLGIAFFPLCFGSLAEHGIAYVGPMLRGWTLLATDFALFALARRAAQAGRLPVYALVLSAVLASAIVAGIGVNEYLLHRRIGDAGWRVFATSTPDFLAGYLVMLLPLTLALFVAIPLRGPRPLIGYLLAVLLLVVLA